MTTSPTHSSDWRALVSNLAGWRAAEKLPLTVQCLRAGHIEPAGGKGQVILVQLAASALPLELRGQLEYQGEEVEGIRTLAPRVRLQAARAWEELAALEKTRAALGAADDGMSQREIGELLDVPQTEVHRLLRRARTSGRDWGREGARELILRYRAGLISRGTMVGSLSSAERGRSGDGFEDGYVPGAWDEIRDAYLDGLLADDEYDELRSRLDDSRSGNAGARRRMGAADVGEVEVEVERKKDSHV